MPSFPLNIELAPPILSQNILGDDFPELVGKSKDRTKLHIFNSKGHELISIATPMQDSLISLGEFKGRSSIFTQSTIYQFDSYEDPLGNYWSTKHGGMGNSRKINLNYSSYNNRKKLLHNTYCYPNPVHVGLGTIRIETNGSASVEVKIYDLAGYFDTIIQKSIHTVWNQIYLNLFGILQMFPLVCILLIYLPRMITKTKIIS